MRNPTVMAARLRGAFVGSAAGAVSIAGHALGGGALFPSMWAITALLAVCSSVGVLVSARARQPRAQQHGFGEILLMLTIAQAVAHLTLASAAGHQHSMGISPVMLGAHLAAVPIGALLIHSGERAVLRAVSGMHHTVRILVDSPAAQTGIRTIAIDRALPGPRIHLLGSGSGLRGPPLCH
ncbi:hypothetical protein ACL02S_02875 [Nocardia sp. 004]|uniref:hypothetical protein n=1 Tax=Nocardia sp. 004 TaxID=3385978 RepID=UPI0039A1BE5B